MWKSRVYSRTEYSRRVRDFVRAYTAANLQTIILYEHSRWRSIVDCTTVTKTKYIRLQHKVEVSFNSTNAHETPALKIHFAAFRPRDGRFLKQELNPTRTPRVRRLTFDKQCKNVIAIFFLSPCLVRFISKLIRKFVAIPSYLFHVLMISSVNQGELYSALKKFFRHFV